LDYSYKTLGLESSAGLIGNHFVVVCCTCR